MGYKHPLCYYGISILGGTKFVYCINYRGLNQVNPIDNYEWGFDENNDLKLDGDETYNIYSHVFEKEPILLSKWFPSDDTKISTYFLYTFIKDENGFTFEEDMFGAVSSGYQHNKRTMAHENGHRIGYNHPWEDEQNNGYKLYDDADALMDYLGILTGFKIRAYQWIN